MTADVPPRRLSRLARRLVPLAVVSGGAIALATALGFVHGWWWVFDLLAALRTQYALGFLVLALLFSLAGARWIALVCLVGFLVNAVLIVPLYFDRPVPPREGDVIRIMFLNTDIRGANIEALINDLETASHDLVFLSATTDRWAAEFESADIPYSVVQARPRGTSVELLLLARHGVAVETSIRDFGEGGRNKAIEAVVRLNGQPTRVLGVHPVSPATAERAARHRSFLEEIALWARLQTDPAIVVGDLNSTPWSPVFRSLLEEGGLTNSQVGYGVQATWPVIMGPAGVPIDHLLHSSELTTVERDTGPGYGSSHRSIHVGVAMASSN